MYERESVSVTVCKACPYCFCEKKQDETFRLSFFCPCLLLQNHNETEGKRAAPGSSGHAAGKLGPGNELPHTAHGAEKKQSPSKKAALEDLLEDSFTERVDSA